MKELFLLVWLCLCAGVMIGLIVAELAGDRGFPQSAHLRMIHTHTKALAELIACAEPFMRRHSGLCMDWNKPGNPVTLESCQCPEEDKKLRAALMSGKAALDYDRPPPHP